MVGGGTVVGGVVVVVGGTVVGGDVVGGTVAGAAVTDGADVVDGAVETVASEFLFEAFPAAARMITNTTTATMTQNHHVL